MNFYTEKGDCVLKWAYRYLIFFQWVFFCGMIHVI